jgi:hypothetical protein
MGSRAHLFPRLNRSTHHSPTQHQLHLLFTDQRLPTGRHSPKLDAEQGPAFQRKNDLLRTSPHMDPVHACVTRGGAAVAHPELLSPSSLSRPTDSQVHTRPTGYRIVDSQ